MNLKNLAAVLCRCLAIYTLINMIYLIPMNLQIFLVPHQNTAVNFPYYDLLTHLSIILLFILSLLIAYLLWFYAERIAARMIQGMDSQQIILAVKAEDLQRAAFSMLGLYVLILSIGFIPRAYITSIALNDNPRVTVDGVIFLIFVILGITLLFGARGLVGTFRKFRNYGLTRPANDNQANIS